MIPVFQNFHLEDGQHTVFDEPAFSSSTDIMAHFFQKKQTEDTEQLQTSQQGVLLTKIDELADLIHNCPLDDAKTLENAQNMIGDMHLALQNRLHDLRFGPMRAQTSTTAASEPARVPNLTVTGEAFAHSSALPSATETNGNPLTHDCTIIPSLSPMGLSSQTSSVDFPDGHRFHSTEDLFRHFANGLVSHGSAPPAASQPNRRPSHNGSSHAISPALSTISSGRAVTPTASHPSAQLAPVNGKANLDDPDNRLDLAGGSVPNLLSSGVEISLLGYTNINGVQSPIIATTNHNDKTTTVSRIVLPNNMNMSAVGLHGALSHLDHPSSTSSARAELQAKINAMAAPFHRFRYNNINQDAALGNLSSLRAPPTYHHQTPSPNQTISSQNASLLMAALAGQGRSIPQPIIPPASHPSLAPHQHPQLGGRMSLIGPTALTLALLGKTTAPPPSPANPHVFANAIFQIMRSADEHSKKEFNLGWVVLKAIWNVTPADFEDQILHILFSTKTAQQREEILLALAAVDLRNVRNINGFVASLIKEQQSMSQLCIRFFAGICDAPVGHCPFVHPEGGFGWAVLQERWGVSHRDIDYGAMSFLCKQPAENRDGILLAFAEMNLKNVKNLSAYLSRAIRMHEKN